MTRSASWWFVAGLTALVGAFIIPAVDGGELSEAWWSAMAGLFLAGIALLITGVITLARRSSSQTHP